MYNTYCKVILVVSLFKSPHQINPFVPKTYTFFGDNLKKQLPLTKVLVHLPLLSNNQNKNQHPTTHYISLEKTLVPWNFRFGGHGNFFWRFCICRVRFWCSRCNSYKDCYSDDDDLFSLDDASHSKVRDIWEAWNAQTPISKPLIPTEINTENGPK